MNRNMMEGFIEVHTGSSSRQALETDSILNIMRCMCKIKAFNLRMRCYYTSKILEEKHISYSTCTSQQPKTVTEKAAEE